MSPADRVRLLHMLEAAEEAVTIGQDHSRTSLLAVMKDIEIIGEAANKVSESLRVAEPGVPRAGYGSNTCPFWSMKLRRLLDEA